MACSLMFLASLNIIVRSPVFLAPPRETEIGMTESRLEMGLGRINEPLGARPTRRVSSASTGSSFSSYATGSPTYTDSPSNAEAASAPQSPTLNNAAAVFPCAMASAASESIVAVLPDLMCIHRADPSTSPRKGLSRSRLNQLSLRYLATLHYVSHSPVWQDLSSMSCLPKQD